MNDNNRALCAATGNMMRASSIVSVWGLLLAMVAIAALALNPLSLPSWIGFGAVAAIGLFERWLALRLRVDAQLFDDLGRGRIVSLAALDGVIERIGLQPAGDLPQRLDERVRGARQMMQLHMIAVACQSAMFLTAILNQHLPTLFRQCT